MFFMNKCLHFAIAPKASSNEFTSKTTGWTWLVPSNHWAVFQTREELVHVPPKQMSDSHSFSSLLQRQEKQLDRGTGR